MLDIAARRHLHTDSPREARSLARIRQPAAHPAGPAPHQFKHSSGNALQYAVSGELNLRPVLRKLLALSGAVGLAVNSGCYAYLPVSPSESPASVGAVVRVTLTAAGSEDLARFLGPRVYGADGRIASTTAEGDPTIAVTWVQLGDGSRQPWMGEGVVTFPKADIANVAMHTLDRQKSSLVAAVFAVALFTMTYVALQGGGGTIRDATSGGGPLTSRAPVASPPN
jgi:hypothetical protein